MRRITFDLDVLRTFVTGVDLGSFAKAADRLGRSTSAVSAQLKKLEQQLGMPVLRKEGRGMVTTSAGESLLGYARRLLELNDEAATAVRGAELAGSVRLGMQEDFGEHILTEVLGRFARVHPKLRIEACVARNADLMAQMAAGRLELALAWSDPAQASPAAGRTPELARLPMRWIGAAGVGDWPAWSGHGEPLPLVMMDAPCMMRSAAIHALDRAGIPWRIAFSSPSLGGVWAAVAAGLGVTVRTQVGLPPALRALEQPGLPPLPVIGLRLHRGADELSAPAQRLHDIVLQAIAAQPALAGAAVSLTS
ncbi:MULTISPECIES: LysR substrate-binding domain-containing protein [unclassified Duganella]|uniref:LysR substrate-binding domain-containing protein n=1 Tax=unclassified Duganella TaxID=2636909 RepID=UPI000E350EBC|nr:MULTISPECIES: LysR substrate-binding domain-containing protein [unclassified Duganella]RFP11296.1 LysR family transcriptional regulator [Duganella sp. BJB475]RFP29615.1 LysR family transcriptional regulator [Duganella sp. BJB476]